MALCRVFYKADGTVAVLHPVEKVRRPGETDAELLDRLAPRAVKGTPLEGLPFDDVSPATLPDRKDREKWRGAKGAGVSVDQTVVTGAERRQTVEAQLDTELAKPAPNPVQALKLQRRLEKGDY